MCHSTDCYVDMADIVQITLIDYFDFCTLLSNTIKVKKVCVHVCVCAKSTEYEEHEPKERHSLKQPWSRTLQHYADPSSIMVPPTWHQYPCHALKTMYWLRSR